MANDISKSIDLIDSQIDAIIKKIKDAQKEIITTSKEARELGNSFSGITTPKGINDTLKQSKENTEQLNAAIKEQNRLERQLISTIAKKTLAQESTAKAVSKENEELKILRREQRNQVKQISNLSTAYEKLQAQTSQLIRKRQDLAVRQKQGQQLNDKEIKQLSSLTSAIKKNQKTLSDTDAEVGRFQRNVGNYASGFDGIGNSIAQLTREAPAFAVSLQTGFLALSNNIPILADEIQRLSKANKTLAAQGKQTKSVFSQVASSFFGFQTLLSAGVLILTLYGDKIFKFLAKVTVGIKKIDALKESQKSYNESLKEGTKNAVAEISQLQLLFRVAEDVTKGTETRNKAVTKLIKSSGGLIKEQDRLNILNGNALELENKLTKAVLNRAIVQQLQTKISEDLNTVIDNQIKISKLEIEQNKLNEQSIKNVTEANVGLTEEEGKNLTQKQKLIASLEKLKNANKTQLEQQGRGLVQADESNKIETKINKVKEQNVNVQDKINFLIKNALKLVDDYTLELDENTKSITKRNKAVALSIQLAEEREKDLKIAKKSLKVLNELFKDDASFKLPEIDTESLERLKEKIDKQIADAYQKILDKELLDQAINDLGNTIEQFTGVSADKLVNFFDKIRVKGIDSFEEIADVAQASFSLIGDVSNAFFQGKIDEYQADIDANNAYYENLLQNETLTDEERKKLEADQRQREKILIEQQNKEKEKQAVANKAFAIADITINTARAVVEALPNIPLSIAIGVLGAAQLATAIATPIPKFAEGGVMDKDGLMMINDHSSGRLEVVERDGKLLMTDQKNALVEGKKGDIIHKDAKEYFNGISDKDIINNAREHSILATISHQNYLANTLSNKMLVDNSKMQTDRIVKAIGKQKTRINLHNNVSLGDELKYINMSNQY